MTVTVLDGTAQTDVEHSLSDEPLSPIGRQSKLTRRWRVVAACLALLALYGALSLFNDPRGTLASDTGGKLATLHVMKERGTLVPDVGYWARNYDPEGLLHPLEYTKRIGDRYVQVTTLPMLELAAPLYDIGGGRAALLLPMLGAVLTALAARALARRLGEGSGWPIFWAVGLVTPVAIYALDFWEHTLGLALMLWAVVLLYDVLERRAGWRGAVGAGALFGMAATLRTEALVDLVVAIGVTCLVMLWRDRALGRPVRIGSLVLIGAVLPLLANATLERLVAGGDLRGARAAGIAATSGSGVSNRVQEALTSGVGIGLGNVRPSTDWAVGALAACLVGMGALAMTRCDRRGQFLGATAVAAAFVVHLMRFGSGLGFVPGLLVASPLAAAGLFVCWREPRARVVGAIACGALPLVWAVQYSGNSWPQWGARYILTSSVLLAACAGAVLQRSPRAFVATCLVAGLVTAGGLWWVSERTHMNANAMATILARHDDVLISRREQFFREVGAYYSPSQHWLSAPTDSQLRDAVQVAYEAGAHELATIGPAGQSITVRIGHYVRGRTQLVPFTQHDIRLQVTTYRLGS